ncbi:uncharacterized protein ELE39_003493 [Cryptosporidium sp. chipmunk genotype I]|uniref:uncharacterized protein n=1 Tax=Cryptosporidium sp. chipmunk genotype I TaxID=1280935 RepID=UPI00351A9E89|nr:hypothetical protein ELE39_003493 [Cryptosporidium sp. chipmunk genotype I]
MKLSLLLSLLVLFVSYLQVNSQDVHHSFRSTALELADSKDQSSCNDNCIQEKNSRSLQDSGSSDGLNGDQNPSGTIGSIIQDNVNNLYKDLTGHAQEQAKNTWDSLSTGAKAGIIIAIVVVAIIIIAGIIHCLCICKLCCCC